MLSRIDATRLISHLRNEGWSGFGRRGSRRLFQALGERLSWAEFDFPLRQEDIADSGNLRLPAPRQILKDQLHIGWVCTPPAAGSGGHTTLFRMVQGLEERGHRCTLFLYDRYADDVARHEEVIRRNWPGMRAGVRSATQGMEDVDAVVASSWATAHVVASRVVGGAHRFYFIQDYEPFFYPRGTFYALAEDTYRFGFRNIALGKMIAGVMENEVGISPDAIVPFGCDNDVYRILPERDAASRSGVVFYAKKNVDRRGYLLAKLALERFHQAHPEQVIHVYGDKVSGWSIPVTDHGNLTPTQLNELYNRTLAGLAISFTNISLVPEELMSAGNIPVLNESAYSRAVLSTDDAVWGRPTPCGMADALAAAVEATDVEARAARVAARERRDWEETKKQVASIIETACAEVVSGDRAS